MLLHCIFIALQPSMLHKKFVKMRKKLHSSEFEGKFHLMFVVKINIELEVRAWVHFYNKRCKKHRRHWQIINTPLTVNRNISLDARLITIEAISAFGASVSIVDIGVTVVAANYYLGNAFFCEAQIGKILKNINNYFLPRLVQLYELNKSNL